MTWVTEFALARLVFLGTGDARGLLAAALLV
jgi:hypothetical protein